MLDEEGVCRTQALAQGVVALLSEKEATYEETLAVGMLLCAHVADMSGIPSHDAAVEFFLGLTQMRKNDARKPLN